MRTFRLVSLFSVVCWIGLSAQVPVRPPGSVTAEAEDHAKNSILTKYGPALADRSKVIMGTLAAAEASKFRHWDLAIKEWKRDKDKASQANALLAEGVLFDCLSRFHGILTGVLSSEERTPYFLDLAAQRPKRASKAFQAALKINPSLDEARFRDARIRAGKDADARTYLESLARRSGDLAFLAAMSRAETARALHDSAGAQLWYERATALRPGAPSPHFGLAGLRPGTALPFGALQDSDIYYSYPCDLLTPQVGEELAKRMPPRSRK